MKILHVFADKGAENPTLDRYGTVYRFSLSAEPNEYSLAVKAIAQHLPIQEDVKFDLGVFHPPCGGVSPMSDTKGGDRNEWPDLIPVARDIAKKYCDHWIIENKPRESLDAEVVLDGYIFNLDIEFRRAFETSFPVDQPTRQDRLAETSPFYYTEWSIGEWASVKGTDVDIASKEHIAKNTVPAAYLDYLLRYYYRAIDDEERPDYSDYDKEMDAKRNREKNAQLEQFQ